MSPRVSRRGFLVALGCLPVAVKAVPAAPKSQPPRKAIGGDGNRFIYAVAGTTLRTGDLVYVTSEGVAYKPLPHVTPDANAAVVHPTPQGDSAWLHLL